MFAGTEKLNILDDHHLVAMYVKYRTVDDLFEIGLIAAGDESHGLFEPLRSLHQAFASGILTKQGEHFPHPWRDRGFLLRHHFYDCFIFHFPVSNSNMFRSVSEILTRCN